MNFDLLANEEETSGIDILLPQVYDWALSLIIFAIILLVVWKVVLPKIQKTLDERSDKIEGGLRRADEAQNKANKTLEKYESLLAAAKKEASDIREDAKKDALQIIAEAKEKASAEIEELKARAALDIKAERLAALDALNSEISSLVVDLSYKVVSNALEIETNQKSLVDAYLKDIK